MKFKHILIYILGLFSFACSDADVCEPLCDGKQCGADGCGGSCGTCLNGMQCINGFCSTTHCIPQCNGKQCGPDGCGGSCGVCPADTICNVNGICYTPECIPDCDNKQCGDDGCGNSCGTCPTDTTCQHGACITTTAPCVPNCLNKACGSDGCGGSCGTCTGTNVCVRAQCVPACIPECTHKTCGDDGCGGSCGVCSNDMQCYNGNCTSCIPSCTSRVCGTDGCGGSCGTCGPNSECNDATGQCMPYRVKGKILIETQTVYYDIYQLPKLDKKVDKPGSRIPISLRNKNGTEIAKTVTNDDGSFELTLDRLPIVTDWISIVPTWSVANQLKLAILVASSSTPYNVWSWSINLSDYASTNDLGDLKDIRITINQGSGALYIYQQLVMAYEDLLRNGFVTDLSSLKSMGAIWKQGMYWPDCGSCFIDQAVEAGNLKQYLNTQMRIGGRVDEESAWGFPTLLHEFGHYVLKLRRDDSRGGTHYMSGTSNPPLAWSEGFATFYYLLAQSLRDKTPVTQYWRVLQSGSYWIDYAHLFESSGYGSLIVPKPSLTHEKAMRQDIAEAWVTYALWNIWDGNEITDPTSPADGISISTAKVFDALASERYLKAFTYTPKDSDGNYRTVMDVDFIDYIDSVICLLKPNSIQSKAIMEFLIKEGFPYDKSPVCP